MTELLLIRHGQTDWNRERKIMGRKPIPLNEQGREQAKKLAHYLSVSPLDVCFSSPVLRAAETAQIICAQQNILPEHRDELSEIDYGIWVDQTFAWVHQHQAEAWQKYRTDPNDLVFPGGESVKQVLTRVARLVDEVFAQHPGKRVAFVSHADVLKFAIAHVFAFPLTVLRQFSVENAGVALIRFDEQLGPRLTWFNSQFPLGD